MRPLSRPGSLLLEALLGIAVFALLAGAVTAVLFVGQEGSIQSGQRVRAVFLASEAVAAARSMRDTSFALLIPGQHGVCIGATGLWGFCGSDQTTSDGFTTTLALQSLTENHVRATAQTTWQATAQRSGSVTLTEELTDWQAIKPIGDWSAVRLAGSSVIDGTPLFSSVALQGSYAFVTGDFGQGGRGLHVFDISGAANPVPVATGLSLGVAAYAALAEDDMLFVATADSSAEIQIFDASNPVNLSLADRQVSIDLPGSGRARSLAYHNHTLFVGALEDTTQPELTTYDVTDPAAPELIGSLDDTASYYGLSLHDGYAYVASSMDASELRVVDVFDSTDPVLAPGIGYNLTDTHDALSIASVNDDLLLGRRTGTAIEEFVLLDLSTSAVPSPPPGPWFQEIGGSVVGLTAEPGGRYAFLATDNITSQLQVADLARFRSGQFAIVSSATTSTGGGRAVAYDTLRDRIVLATDRALLIFRPGA